MYDIPTGNGKDVVLKNMRKTYAMKEAERIEKLEAHKPHQGSKEMQRRRKQMERAK